MMVTRAVATIGAFVALTRAPLVAWAQEEPAPAFDMAAAKTAVHDVDLSECGTGGRGRVTITFATDGTVAKATVTEGNFDADAVDCIEGGFREVRVPAFSGEPHTIAVKFELLAEPPKLIDSQPPVPHARTLVTNMPYARIAIVIVGSFGALSTTGTGKTAGIALGPEFAVQLHGFEVGTFWSEGVVQNGHARALGVLAGYALSLGPVDLDLAGMYGARQYEDVWGDPDRSPFDLDIDFGTKCTHPGASASMPFVGGRLGIARRPHVGGQLSLGLSLDVKHDLAVKDVESSESCTSNLFGESHWSKTEPHRLGGTEVMLAFRLGFARGW